MIFALYIVGLAGRKLETNLINKVVKFPLKLVKWLNCLMRAEYLFLLKRGKSVTIDFTLVESFLSKDNPQRHR